MAEKAAKNPNLNPIWQPAVVLSDNAGGLMQVSSILQTFGKAELSKNDTNRAI